MLRSKSKTAAILIMVMVVICVVGTVNAVEEININTASLEELMQLEGVGSTYAQKIIDYRDATGPFEAPEDIMNVKGIGESTYEKNRDRITVGQVEEGLSGSN